MVNVYLIQIENKILETLKTYTNVFGKFSRKMIDDCDFYDDYFIKEVN